MDSTFLQALAQARPDPGGGAAAAHGAALGLALLEKVVRLEEQRQSRGTGQPFPWDDLLRRVRLVAAALGRLQEEDIQAYFNLTQARDSGDPEKVKGALEEAIGCPLRIMQQAQEGLGLISQGGGRCKKHLLSDLLVATELLGAAFRGAHHIARANLLFMARNPRRLVWAEDLDHTLKAAEAMFQQVLADLLERQQCP
ncbi:MAG: cyclodeaminase/cyclohydrolase family protein [Thermodesulfobacteriota bacterium]